MRRGLLCRIGSGERSDERGGATFWSFVLARETVSRRELSVSLSLCLSVSPPLSITFPNIPPLSFPRPSPSLSPPPPLSLRDAVRSRSQSLGTDFLGFLTSKISEEGARVEKAASEGGYDCEEEEMDDRRWLTVLELIARVVRDVAGGGETRDNVDTVAMAMRFKGKEERANYLAAVMEDMSERGRKSLLGTVEDVFRSSGGDGEVQKLAKELVEVYGAVDGKVELMDGGGNESGGLLSAASVLYLT